MDSEGFKAQKESKKPAGHYHRISPQEISLP